MVKKVLLDTDIGSDIDDAVCLAYLLCNPECKLEGITTVSGQPLERAMLCDALCKAAKKNVPIRAGTANPMIIGNKQPSAPQAETLPNHPHDVYTDENTAVEFMRDVIYKNPGEIILLSIGPTTNVGLLFATYPKAAGLLAGYTLMCGDFIRESRGMEWNAICDPHACRIAYDARVKFHRSVGLNVTTKVTMAADEVRRRFKHPVLKVVADFAEVWFRRGDTITFHDPLAGVGIFDENVMDFERGAVRVELGAEDELGRTTFVKDAGGPCEVASDVYPDVFFKSYFSVFE